MAYFEHAEQYTIQNQYGKVVLESVVGPRKVKYFRDYKLPKDMLFSLDTAEQITLICESAHVQVAIAGFKACYALVHLASNICIACRVKELVYTGPEARKVLAREIPQLACKYNI